MKFIFTMNGKLQLKNRRKGIVIVLLIIIIAYGLLLVRFSLRNDQMNYFLPVRMFMSDAFNLHEFMLWNPFIGGSYPLHVDMQGPVWNPFTVLLSFLFDYNATLLSIEFLVYYLLGAVGCFYFAGNFTRHVNSRIVIAVCYGCSGFATSIPEFMSWVGSLAFLPWAIHFFYLLLTKREPASVPGLAISMWLLLVCGYPSFLIYLGYIFLITFLAWCYRRYRHKKQDEIPGLLKLASLAFILFVLLSLPAIHSYYEYLSYYVRGARTSNDHINSESFSWGYLMSFIFPGGGTGLYDNNIYFGILPFLLLCISIRKGGKVTFRDKFLLVGCLFTFLFTLGAGTPVRMWSAQYLPFMATFGFSHSVRVFLILAFLVWLAPPLTRLLQGISDDQARRIRKAAMVAGILLVIYLLIGATHLKFKTAPNRYFFYAGACWQLLLIGVLCFSKWIYGSGKRLFILVLVDLVMAVFTVIPVTSLSITPSSTYNRFASDFYTTDASKDLMVPVAAQRNSMVINPRTEVNALKLAIRPNFPSKTRLDTLYQYLKDPAHTSKLMSLPFLFTDDSTAIRVTRIDLRYNTINIDLIAADSCNLVLQQTFYQRWRSADPAHVPGIWQGVLLQVPLRKGENKVRLYYYHTDLLVESIIAVTVLVGLLLGLLFRWRSYIL